MFFSYTYFTIFHWKVVIEQQTHFFSSKISVFLVYFFENLCLKTCFLFRTYDGWEVMRWMKPCSLSESPLSWVGVCVWRLWPLSLSCITLLPSKPWNSSTCTVLHITNGTSSSTSCWRVKTAFHQARFPALRR